MSNLVCQPFKKEFRFVSSGDVGKPGAFTRDQTRRNVPVAYTSGQTTVPLNPFLAPAVRRIAILDRYYSFTLPLDRRDWGYGLQSFVSALQSRELSLVSIAMASSFCSSVDNDANLQAAGLQVYMKAVSDLRSRAMSFRQNWGHLLIASIILFQYEVCTSSHLVSNYHGKALTRAEVQCTFCHV